MKHLVTGAAGFLGRTLCTQLTNRGAEVVSVGLVDPKVSGVRHLECDLVDARKTYDVVSPESPERVYHFAGAAKVSDAIGLPAYYQSNFLTTAHLLQALAKGPAKKTRLFLASSVHVYGNRSGKVVETTPPYPTSAYGFSKFLAERACAAATGATPNLECVIGRLYTCIGPGQAPGFVTSDLARRLRGLADGDTLHTAPLDATRQFLDARDAVALIVQLMEIALETNFELVHIASPTQTPVRVLVETLVKVSRKQVRIQPSAQTDNRFQGLDLSTEKLSALIPDFTFTPTDQTLREIWECSA